MSSLPEEQLKLLTANISEDVVSAMRQIVTYILRAPGGEGALDKDAEVRLTSLGPPRALPFFPLPFFSPRLPTLAGDARAREAPAALPVPAGARLHDARSRGDGRGVGGPREVGTWQPNLQA